MKRLPVYVVLISWLLANAVWAQSGAQPEPQVDVVVKADGKPVTDPKGIPAKTQTLEFTAALSAESRQRFPDFQPQAVIKSAWVSLARGTRRIATTFSQAGQPLTIGAGNAQPGDRYVIEFDLAARRKDGRLMPLTSRVIRSIALY